MRRSRLDIRLGRQLRVGQELRRRTDGTVWRIAQLYRADCQALLERDSVDELVRFERIRGDYDLVVPLQEAA